MSNKKVFVSMPMRDRHPSDIRHSIGKAWRIAEATVGEPLDLIDSVCKGVPYPNSKEDIWYLGESIMRLSMADYIVVVRPHFEYTDCLAESMIARGYGIPEIIIDREWVCPDLVNAEEEDFE